MTKQEKNKKRGWCGRTARILRHDATKSEIVLRSKLCDCGFNRHRFQKYFISDEHIFIADFFIIKLGLVIEVDGDYHFSKAQMKKDAIKDRFYLSRKEVKGILRLTDDQALYLSPTELKRIILSIKPKECLVLY